MDSMRQLMRIRPITNVASQCIRRAAQAAAVNDAETKHWRSLPRMPGWPLVGNVNMVFNDMVKNGQMHILLHNCSIKYGKMFRTGGLGMEDQVYVNDPHLTEALFRQEGKYPVRTQSPSWADFRDRNNFSRGLLTSDFEMWAKFRSALSKRLLRAKNVNEYCPQLDEVVTDMVTHLRRVMKKEGNGVFIPDLANEFYKWGMESTCVIIFEKRLGCLEEAVNSRAKRFIDGIYKMWLNTLHLYNFYGLHKRIKSKAFKGHEEAWMTVFEIARDVLNEKMVELKEADEANEEMAGGLLTYLLGKKELSTDEIVSNITELMLAGVDTTSNSLSFAMYLLAKYPEKQQNLYDEIMTLVGDREATTDDLNNMSYLKAVVKETMRIYPVAPLNARVLKTPVTLAGYQIDPGVVLVFNLYAMGHNPEIHKNPEDFIPERWIRGSGGKSHPFANIPFGHGVRSCIGRRFAELELYLAIIKVLQNFQLKPHGDMNQLKPFFRTILSPGKVVPVEFHERRK